MEAKITEINLGSVPYYRSWFSTRNLRKSFNIEQQFEDKDDIFSLSI